VTLIAQVSQGTSSYERASVYVFLRKTLDRHPRRSTYRFVAIEPISLLLLFLREEDFDLSLLSALPDSLQCPQEPINRLIYEFLCGFIFYCWECHVKTFDAGWLNDPKEPVEEDPVKDSSKGLPCRFTVDYLNTNKTLELLLAWNDGRTRSNVSVMKEGQEITHSPVSSLARMRDVIEEVMPIIWTTNKSMRECGNIVRGSQYVQKEAGALFRIVGEMSVLDSGRDRT
jgi:hypothetical protein